jgi:hypothetical protein
MCESGHDCVISFTTPTTQENLLRKGFCYDYDDGMWATICARELWEVRPHLRPHSTLFELLYKKLDLH